MPRPTNDVLTEDDGLFGQGLRRCRTCDSVLSVSDFGRYGRDRHGLQKSCKPCTNSRNREKYYPNLTEEAKERRRENVRKWRANLSDEERRQVNRKANIRQLYKISVEEYDEYLSKPCEICGRPSEHLDHDHDTEKIRAALCAACNVALGGFKDNPDLLRAAADYVERHKPPAVR